MPAAWELLKANEERILVAVIMPPDLAVSIDFAQNLRALQLTTGSDFMRVIGLPYGPARNNAAKTAMERGYHLVFIDADMRVQANAVITLLNTKLPIVSGLYYQRFPPYMPCFFNEGRDQQNNPVKVPIGGWQPGQIVPCDFIPSGLTLYRRELLQAMFARFPRPFEWGVDTAPVPSESGQAPPYSEDFTFSWRAKQLGFQPMCHTGVVGLHETKSVVGPRWVVPYPSNDPTHGVIGVM